MLRGSTRQFPVTVWSIAALYAAFAPIATTVGDDWPQWMGPSRDNVWREDGLLDEFPATGPKVLWRAAIAGGYAGPAIAAGRVFVTDYVTDADVKVANFERKASTGTELRLPSTSTPARKSGGLARHPSRATRRRR